MNRVHVARLCAGFVVGLAALAVEASAAVVVLTPDRDNTMYEEYSDNSNGAGFLFAGRAGGGGIRRALLRFDVAGSVPPGSQIDAVELRFAVSRAATADPLPASLHRILGDWGEAGSNAGERSGIGTQAQMGDATWTYRFYASTPWLVPGGDFTSTASVSAMLGGVGTHVFGSTPELIDDVQTWLDAPVSNFGWILRADESSAGTARRIDSREGDVLSRPTLTISYSEAPVPVPIPRTTLAIIAAALGCLIVRFASRATFR